MALFFQLFGVFEGSELYLECLLREGQVPYTVRVTSLLLSLSTAFHLVVQVIYQREVGGQEVEQKWRSYG